MQQNSTPNSFQIGEQFERYVLKKLFSDTEYQLISRTNNYQENSERFSEDTLKPDFKFRCLETKKEFYVEAKYRSDFTQDKIEGISFQQAQRFRNIQEQEGIPIYIVIGYWRTPDNPYAVSLIPLNEYDYPEMFRSFLQRYELPKGDSPEKFLKLQEEKAEKKVNTEYEHAEPSVKKSKLKYLITLGIAAILLVSGIYAFTSNNSSIKPETQLKQRISDYYQAMNSNQIERLPEFLSSDVESWYGNTDPDLSGILKDARNHRNQYPFSKSYIEWDSYHFVHQEDGNYYASFKMIYSAKKKISDEYKIFNLKIISKWDKDLRLKSITEIRND